MPQANASLRKDSTSGVKGVSWAKRERKWISYISVNGKRIGLGYYTSKAAAAEAYERAAKLYFGEFARPDKIQANLSDDGPGWVNQRKRILECDGKRQSVSDWAREVGVNYSTLQGRLRKGWDAKSAIFGRSK